MTKKLCIFILAFPLELLMVCFTCLGKAVSELSYRDHVITCVTCDVINNTNIINMNDIVYINTIYVHGNTYS